MKSRLLLALVVCSFPLACNRNAGTTSGGGEPARVAQHVEEETLNRITLTEKAEQRLGIQLVEVEFREVARRRRVGGDVVLPPGQTIVVSAPIAGTLARPQGGVVPPPGLELETGQAVFDFKPMLTPERDVLTTAERVRVAQTKADVATAQIEAERQIESARVSVEAAQIAHERALTLLQNRAASQRTVDETGTQLQLAREAQVTAEARHRFLSGIDLDEQAGELASRPIEAPVSGILQGLQAAPGETVAAGQPLFTVMETDRVWVRVPVYVGHWRDIRTDQEASIREYGQIADGQPRSGKYVSAPPSANAVATTVDLYYELANDDGRLCPGQKLEVTLPLRGSSRALVAPFSAVLYDIHGGAWVYEQLEPHVYARRRVSIEYVDGQDAVLNQGPQAGARVVTDGAVELFGAEFGVGH